MIAPESQATWHKSSYSSNKPNCVETDYANWRKSSCSSSSEANCVEVAVALLVIGVRDPKNRGWRPRLPRSRVAHVPHRPKFDALRGALRSLRPVRSFLCGCDAPCVAFS
jgi:hypothetical protein